MELRVLAVGDVVGVSGLKHLEKHLRGVKRLYGVDFCVVNGENASVVGLTPQQADAVEPARIARLFAGDLGRRILQAEELHREFKFSLLMDAAAYFPQAAGEQVMLQGVVDCFWIERGELVIVDFKTDRLRDGAQARALEYAPQVHAYAQALSRIWQLPVRECILYFFDTGEAVSL